MVRRLQKLLRKLSQKQRMDLEYIIEKITRNDLSNLDVKKLQGWEAGYRVRKGTFRIIFLVRDGEYIILSVERRNSTTYST